MHDDSKIFRSFLDQLGMGVAILDGGGRILHLNSAAAGMIASGEPIRSRGGYLRGVDGKTSEAIAKTLAQAAETARTGDIADARRDISLAICPGRRSAAVGCFVPLTVACAPNAHDAVVALFVMRVRPNLNPNLSGFARCFGLTPAETRTLEHIVRGRGLPEAGAALGLAENTVKTHLKSIFTKTETSRQTELLALVHTLRPPLSEGACAQRPGATRSAFAPSPFPPPPRRLRG